MAAFQDEEPDRVPAWCGSSIEFWKKAKRTTRPADEGLRRRFGDDFRRIIPLMPGPSSPCPLARLPEPLRHRARGPGLRPAHPAKVVDTTLPKCERLSVLLLQVVNGLH